MTVERLSRYRTICVELNEIKSELRELESIDAVQTASKFPYSKHTVPVYGLPPGSDIKKLRQQEAYLKSEKLIIENFVDDIEDKEVQSIVKWRYIKGRKKPSWQAIAMRLGHCSENTPKNKLKKYFSDCGFCGF